MDETIYGSGIVIRNIAGHKIGIDGNKATIWADVPEKANQITENERIYRNPASLFSRSSNILTSFSLVRFGKVKPFIDGVYSVVEEQVAKEAGSFSRPELLRNLERQVRDEEARLYISVARAIGNESVTESDSLRSALSLFEKELGISLPQGLCDWSPELRTAFRQIKATGTRPGFFFGRENDEEFNRTIRSHIDQALCQNPELDILYRNIVDIYAKMTNPPTETSALFPSALLPDQEFFKKLSSKTKSDLEEGLGKLLVQGMKDGKIEFSLKPNSGLYDWQMQELIPLILRKEREFEKFLPGNNYSKLMENEFISQWAATRHTHVAHTDYRDMLIGCALAPERKITITPELYAEPFVTGYERMAETLSFLRRTVVSFFGDEFLNKRRLLQGGERSRLNLGEEFSKLENILLGLSLNSKDSIHQPYEYGPEQEGYRNVANVWLNNISTDPDLNRDTAIFVPIIRETSGERYISYVVPGFRLVDLNVGYDAKPRIGTGEDYVNYEFESANYRLPVLVHKEVRIPKDRLINDRLLRERLPKVLNISELDEILRKI